MSFSSTNCCDNSDFRMCNSGNIQLHCVSQQNWHPFCFCHNFVSHDQILVLFGSLVAKKIGNRTLLTDLKEIAGALRYVENQLSRCKKADDAESVQC